MARTGPVSTFLPLSNTLASNLTVCEKLVSPRWSTTLDPPYRSFFFLARNVFFAIAYRSPRNVKPRPRTKSVWARGRGWVASRKCSLTVVTVGNRPAGGGGGWGGYERETEALFGESRGPAKGWRGLAWRGSRGGPVLIRSSIKNTR